MNGATLDAALEAELEAAVVGLQCELVHAEWKGGILRLFVDREGGVRLEDCERVSRAVSPLLDALGFGNGRYVLEVSSPGLDRGLYKPRDFERFSGRLARIQFVNPETARKRTVVGRLGAVSPGGDGEVELVDRDNGELHRISLRNITTARLEVEL
jgi:ribosome maturation factor RimP